jgi:hypothetical protein
VEDFFGDKHFFPIAIDLIGDGHLWLVAGMPISNVTFCCSFITILSCMGNEKLLFWLSICGDAIFGSCNCYPFLFLEAWGLEVRV